MIRTKGEAGTGDVIEAVRHMRCITREIKTLTLISDMELMAEAKRLQAPYELVRKVASEGRLPVPNFAAGGLATPADASLLMQLGAESVFVVRLELQGPRVPVEFDRAVGALEVVAGGDLLPRLVHGVVDLLEVDAGGNVERAFLGHRQ